MGRIFLRDRVPLNYTQVFLAQDAKSKRGHPLSSLDMVKTLPEVSSDAIDLDFSTRDRESVEVVAATTMIYVICATHGWLVWHVGMHTPHRLDAPRARSNQEPEIELSAALGPGCGLAPAPGGCAATHIPLVHMLSLYTLATLACAHRSARSTLSQLEHRESLRPQQCCRAALSASPSPLPPHASHPSRSQEGSP